MCDVRESLQVRRKPNHVCCLTVCVCVSVEITKFGKLNIYDRDWGFAMVLNFNRYLNQFRISWNARLRWMQKRDLLLGQAQLGAAQLGSTVLNSHRHPAYLAQLASSNNSLFHRTRRESSNSHRCSVRTNSHYSGRPQNPSIFVQMGPQAILYRQSPSLDLDMVVGNCLDSRWAVDCHTFPELVYHVHKT